MEPELNNDDFEIFLKQKVDQHKLYPSDKAWKGIYNSLHPGMKWFKIGGTLLVLSTLWAVYQETSLFNSSNSFSKKTLINSVTPPPAVINKLSGSSVSNFTPIAAGNISRAPIYSSIEEPSAIIAGSSSNPVENFSLSGPVSFNTGTIATINNTGSLNPNNSTLSNDITSTNAVANSSTTTDADIITSTNNTGAALKNNVKVNRKLGGFLLHGNILLSLSSPINVAVRSNHFAPAKDQKDEALTNTDNNEFLRPIVSAVIGNTLPREEVSVNINWLQEMAAIKLTPLKQGKFNLQFYFSPTVSYRRLTDNRNSSHSNPSRDQDINKYVDHSPAIGAELGSNFLFSLTRNLTLKSGLQLNYSRYNIKAFKTTYEKASIALNTSGSVPDTLSSYTSIRNFSGYASEELQNQYMQVSIPVGAELKIAGNKRLQFSVAGTIQPTFLLFSDTYLLSTNYTNYTKEPSLVRKWNVHSSFETYVSYKTGGFRWQLGPQFRYQLMSSFNDRYPIKEYLFEYGVKIGVSKTIR